MKPLFPLGDISATLSALQAMMRLDIGLKTLVDRHRVGDWGDLDEDFRRENDVSVKHGFRIMSVYLVGPEMFYVVTEADRSNTTVYLHECY